MPIPKIQVRTRGFDGIAALSMSRAFSASSTIHYSGIKA